MIFVYLPFYRDEYFQLILVNSSRKTSPRNGINNKVSDANRTMKTKTSSVQSKADAAYTLDKQAMTTTKWESDVTLTARDHRRFSLSFESNFVGFARNWDREKWKLKSIVRRHTEIALKMESWVAAKILAKKQIRQRLEKDQFPLLRFLLCELNLDLFPLECIWWMSSFARSQPSFALKWNFSRWSFLLFWWCLRGFKLLMSSSSQDLQNDLP